jgi:transcriptional regulator with XRE-family HTH domain
LRTHDRHKKEAQARFGANVEDLRQRAGLSLDALAERSQLDRADLNGILNGESEASASTAYRLAGALGVDPGDLFSGMGWPPPADSGDGYAIEEPKRH